MWDMFLKLIDINFCEQLRISNEKQNYLNHNKKQFLHVRNLKKDSNHVLKLKKYVKLLNLEKRMLRTYID